MHAGPLPETTNKAKTSGTLSGLIRTLLFVGFLTVHGGALAAEVQTLEAVGTVPIDSRVKTRTAPREAAIGRALREAVERVAQNFLDDAALKPLPEAENNGESQPRLENPDNPDQGPGSVPDESIEEPDPIDWVAVLGKKMLPYTARFRVLEDRGRRPALFSDDPNVNEEYVVIVEVQVDVDRVRERLLDKGLILAGAEVASSGEIKLEVEGLNLYPAYLALRQLLMESAGVLTVSPIEMSRGTAVLGLETSATAPEILELLLNLAPPDFEIVPIGVADGSLRIALEWTPRSESEIEAELGEPDQNGDPWDDSEDGPGSPEGELHSGYDSQTNRQIGEPSN